MIRTDQVKQAILYSMKYVNNYLVAKDEVRERIIKKGRDVIKESGYVITSLHSGDTEEALKHLSRMQELFEEVRELSNRYPDLRHSGLMNNIASEYVEAMLFYSLITEGELLRLDQLPVDPVPYVQGLLDLVGEIKRHILDLLRKEEYERAMELFDVVEIIYENTRTLDFPEPILPGVRRKVDVARTVTESLRTLLTDLHSRKKLMEALESCRG